MHNKTIAELSAALQQGDVSSVELTQHFIERIETLDVDLNAFITVTPDEARNCWK